MLLASLVFFLSVVLFVVMVSLLLLFVSRSCLCRWEKELTTEMTSVMQFDMVVLNHGELHGNSDGSSEGNFGGSGAEAVIQVHVNTVAGST